MKKIIVPTDFSYPSNDALNFALEIAPALKARVKVIHVYSGSFDTNEPFIIRGGKGHYETLLEQLEEFINFPNENGTTPTLSKIKIEYDAISGLVDRKIIKLSKSPDTEMIVMGTTGSHGISGKLFGSISTDISRSAHCPVLLIPAGVSFQGFNRILFASNYKPRNELVIKKLTDFARLFKANIHFVHVQEEKESSDYKEIESQIFDLLFNKENPSFSFNMIKVDAHSVVEGLNDYVIENNIDLVVMVSPHRSFWQSIFHKSRTKALAFNTKVPLLVLHPKQE